MVISIVWIVWLSQSKLKYQRVLRNCGNVLSKMTYELIASGKDVSYRIDDKNSFCEIGRRESKGEHAGQQMP